MRSVATRRAVSVAHPDSVKAARAAATASSTCAADAPESSPSVRPSEGLMSGSLSPSPDRLCPPISSPRSLPKTSSLNDCATSRMCDLLNVL